jgi:hypothetical protein
MRLRRSWICGGIVAVAAVPVNVLLAPSATAGCVDAGGATVCAQGTVRGGGPDAPTAGPFVPYPCEYDWYCDDGDLDLIINPGPPGGGIDIGRPGRPGGGLGPR